MNFFKPKFWDKNKVSFFSILLYPIALLIKILAFIKRYLSITNRFSIPVICVGNIYLGGTGKTPLCIEIFSILKDLNMNPVFIRKKYSSFEDEANLQKQVGKVYENKKRSRAIKDAIEENANIAILDDGFQDFSINKDLSIICFNEKQWIGNGLVIPAGPLRENLSSLKRAHIVIINGKKNDFIKHEILKQNINIKIFYSNFIPENIELLKNKNITAFAGIGNPKNFFDLLKAYKVNIVKKIEFPDHYDYSEKDLKNLLDEAQKNNSILLTTEKDYFRISEVYKKKINYLKVSIKIDDKKEFVSEIKKFV
tara:strand:- start:1487 stop:2416 length:930 start_codon:yes stop_codon:yes gene_type:complete